jgi:hypothetical protein
MSIRRYWLPFLLTFGFIAAGSALRLTRLGNLEFLNDELDHYYAAQSLAAGRGPLLPSGEAYRRGIDVTRLTGVALRHLGPPELAARLPAAIFGCLNLVLFALVAWRMAGPWAAVIATALLAFYPEAVTQSRQTRFYTYQLNFGLIAMFAGWNVLRNAGTATILDQAARREQLAWLIVTLLAFAAATRVQLTTMSVVAGWFVACAIAAAADLKALGRRALRASFPLKLVLIATAIGLAIGLVSPHLISSLLWQTKFVPSWDGSVSGPRLEYLWDLEKSFPLILGLAPVLFIAAAFWNLRLAVYLLVWFAVPVTLHSLLFAWKAERYVLLAMPALFLAAAIAAERGARVLYARIVARLSHGDGSAQRPHVLAAGLIATVALFMLGTSPAFRASRHAVSGQWRVQLTNWRAVDSVIRSLPGSATMVVGTSDPLPSYYYLHRVDFTVNRHELEVPGRGQQPVGSRDFYVGMPVLTTPEALVGRFGSDRDLLIAVDSVRWNYSSLEPELVRLLERDAQELCAEKCGAMKLFRWHPLDSTSVMEKPASHKRGREVVRFSDAGVFR